MPRLDDLAVSPVPPASRDVHTNVVIAADDGVELIGDLYVPPGEPPFPAVVEITPYNARHLATLGDIYAARGFVFLAVDVRGRYRSAGAWEPLLHDRRDGHAVINWLAAHPLCNGRVGSRGHSYSGYNQLLAAIDAPRSLQAMVVGVAPGDVFDNVPFQGGAYDLSDLMWLMGMTGRVCSDEADAEDLSDARLGLIADSTVDYAEVEPDSAAPAQVPDCDDHHFAWCDSSADCIVQFGNAGFNQHFFAFCQSLQILLGSTAQRGLPDRCFFGGPRGPTCHW